jgi:FkbM family methyltransferase
MRLLGNESEFVIKHLPRVGLVSADLPNGRTLRLVTRGNDWIPNQVFWRGWRGYEPDVSPVFFELARRARVVLDVGANIGFYSLLAGHANPTGHVFGFEPLRGPLEAFERNVAANGLQNVDVVPAAAGAASGYETFYFTRESQVPSSSSLSYEFMKSVPALDSHAVRVVRLDDFVSERRLDVDLIKIDTESTESRVLEGLQETLERDRPHIVLEMLDSPAANPEAIDRLTRPLGYQPRLLSLGGDFVGCPTVVGVVGNIHFVPPAMVSTSPPKAR